LASWKFGKFLGFFLVFFFLGMALTNRSFFFSFFRNGSLLASWKLGEFVLVFFLIFFFLGTTVTVPSSFLF
jgi:hypothetical protein